MLSSIQITNIFFLLTFLTSQAWSLTIVNQTTGCLPTDKILTEALLKALFRSAITGWNLQNTLLHWQCSLSAFLVIPFLATGLIEHGEILEVR